MFHHFKMGLEKSRQYLLTALKTSQKTSLYMGLINKVDMVCLSPVGYGV